MALVPVEIVNKSGRTVNLMLDEGGEMLAYFQKQVRADALESAKVLKPAPVTRKTPAPAK
ncbi:hypothetical protein ACIGPN_05895 [Streptomyces afghaniensis]|uniref:hypothetical protein n=1 Tax=Streptomyces afghaniensis TaxID=66865 RepID=UPI0037D75B12